LEKNIKDKLKSSAVMSQEVPSKFFWRMKNFCQLSCLLKRNKGEMSLLYLKASRGDGTK
jgi:hypothetical protein